MKSRVISLRAAFQNLTHYNANLLNIDYFVHIEYMRKWVKQTHLPKETANLDYNI